MTSGRKNIVVVDVASFIDKSDEEFVDGYFGFGVVVVRRQHTCNRRSLHVDVG